MQERQTFTAEFEREAVRLLKAGDRPTVVIARELGIPLRSGIRQDAPNQGFP